MNGAELHLRMIRAESRLGPSEGRLTYDTGVMNMAGAPADELHLSARRADENNVERGRIRYEKTDDGWTAVFNDPA